MSNYYRVPVTMTGTLGASLVALGEEKLDMLLNGPRPFTPEQVAQMGDIDELSAFVATRRRRERLVECASGLSFSLQASKYWGHYCVPKSDTPPWTAFEIGDCSRHVRELEPYESYDGVYADVPAAVVRKVIADNGGMI